MTSLSLLLVIFLFAFVCEWINVSIGMGYGTILSPLLIILGFPIHTVVPAILISQACGGFFASYFHHSLKNARFKIQNGKLSEDLMTVLWISLLGVFAIFFASVASVKLIPQSVLNMYVGYLVLIMGLFILIGFTFHHSKEKLMLVGLVSAFNKGLSGGGFGPLVTGGQIVLGSKHRNAVGVTMFAEGPICIAGFISYWVLNGITQWEIVWTLIMASLLAVPFGAHTTAKLRKQHLTKVIAIVLIVLGTLMLMRIYGVMHFSVSL